MSVIEADYRTGLVGWHTAGIGPTPKVDDADLFELPIEQVFVRQRG